MEFFKGIFYLLTFFGSAIIVLQILLHSNIEKIFKKGRLTTIKVTYCVLSIIGAHLLASSFVGLLEAFINILGIQ